jgi:hypothetical protein
MPKKLTNEQRDAMEELREIAMRMVETDMSEDEFLAIARQAFEDAEVAAEDVAERDSAYRDTGEDEGESAPHNE